jgi:hypothetical protein
MPNVGQELLNVPLPEMVERLALGIAKAQTNLDKNSTAVAKFMANTRVKLPDLTDPTKDKEFSLISLGFFPGFYQFQEAVIEVKMAISFEESKDFGFSASVEGGWGPVTASVNASYSQKYSYSVDGSSVLKVKLAPAPPPRILNAYMDALIKKFGEIQADIEAANRAS